MRKTEHDHRKWNFGQPVDDKGEALTYAVRTVSNNESYIVCEASDDNSYYCRIPFLLNPLSYGWKSGRAVPAGPDVRNLAYDMALVEISRALETMDESSLEKLTGLMKKDLMYQGTIQQHENAFGKGVFGNMLVNTLGVRQDDKTDPIFGNMVDRGQKAMLKLFGNTGDEESVMSVVRTWYGQFEKEWTTENKLSGTLFTRFGDRMEHGGYDLEYDMDRIEDLYGANDEHTLACKRMDADNMEKVKEIRTKAIYEMVGYLFDEQKQLQQQKFTGDVARFMNERETGVSGIEEQFGD